MPNYQRRNVHGDPFLVPGDRVGFDETYWEYQGRPFIFGSVTGYDTETDHIDPRTGNQREMVTVLWDDGETTSERADQTGGGAFYATDAHCYLVNFDR